MNLLTPDAVAERLAIAVPTLAKWRARGDGPESVRVPRPKRGIRRNRQSISRGKWEPAGNQWNEGVRLGFGWRRGSESNRRIKVLQTLRPANRFNSLA